MRAIAWDMLFLGLDLTDTIVARVTGRGPAGLAVVRLSGSKARAIAARMAPHTQDRPSHQLHRTAVCDAEGADIDEGMAVSMHAPKTYTGEDVVEFFLHGADVIADAVVQAAVALGARLAQPGEFTRRAFAAGRITLAQAEAVGALGGATSGLEQQHALGELKAGLSQEVLGMLEQLEPVLAGFFAVLDFPEHPTETGAASKHSKVLVGVLNVLERRIKTARNRADAPDEVVLAGASNVGKSTLFNALVGQQRALVDEEAGTTRDKISAPMVVGGLPLMLSDTAGLRATPSAVEQKGIALGQQAAQGAELVLWLIDAAHPVWPSGLRNKQLWVVGARADRFDAHARLRLEKEAVGRGLHIRLWVSGFTSEGISALTEALVGFRSRQIGDASDGPEAWMAQPRHLGLLEAAREALVRALAHLEQDGPLDLAATELRLAIDALGQIVGRNVDAAVLDQIFLQFCIGK